MEACKACTLGQISKALYQVGGQYRRHVSATYEDWRKSVEAELKGKALEEALFVAPVVIPRPATSRTIPHRHARRRQDLDAGADAIWDENEVAISRSPSTKPARARRPRLHQRS